MRIAAACLIWALSAHAGLPQGLDESHAAPARASAADRLLALAGFERIQKSYALVVGISQFDDFPDLPTAQDPLRVRDYLLDEAGFDHVHILTEDKVTKARLQELMLDELRPRVGPDDRFVLYWSGHGETLQQGSGTRGFLPLSHSRPGRYSTMVSMDDIAYWDSFLAAHQVLYLLDSCFSGLAGAAPQSDLADITRAQLSGPSRHVITAGRGDEQTIAIDALGGSVFTHALLKGLGGDADSANANGRDGLITVGELKTFIGQEVTRLRARYGWRQSITPQIRDLRGSDGAFFFPVAAAFTSQPAPPGGEIAEVQQALADLGYDPGAVDGTMGLRTRAALILFQTAQGLEPTGEIDAETLAKLPYALAAQVRAQSGGETDAATSNSSGEQAPNDDNPWSKDVMASVVPRVRPAVSVAEPAAPPESEPPLKIYRDGEQEALPGAGFDLLAVDLVTFQPCPGCPELVRVPAGKMAYGPRSVGHPIPPLTEELDAFFISRTEVTIGQYRDYLEQVRGVRRFEGLGSKSCFAWDAYGKMKRTAQRFSNDWDGAETYPVSCVSRQDALDYVDWLNTDNPGPAYRLPTEAEVEYLLDLSPRNQWESGADLCQVANFADVDSPFSWRNVACADAHAAAAPVGSFAPDAFGIFDLAGNLWEWVDDCWRGNLSLPKAAANCDTGTVKGGSFDDPLKNAVPETRQPVPSNRRQVNIGFRIARDAQ